LPSANMQTRNITFLLDKYLGIVRMHPASRKGACIDGPMMDSARAFPHVVVCRSSAPDTGEPAHRCGYAYSERLDVDA
jgi:hypothetical protein